MASAGATAIQFPIHRPPLHLSLNSFHNLHIHQRLHTRLPHSDLRHVRATSMSSPLATIPAPYVTQFDLTGLRDVIGLDLVLPDIVGNFRRSV